jgi:hypothetical protein
MNASEIIEKIKDLPANECAQVAKFIAKKTRDDFVLSNYPPVKVSDLESWLVEPISEQNKKNLIDCIHHRLNDRYIVPLESISKSNKSGFLIMAAVCLLIETLQQFHNGQDETRGKHEEAFEKFFENDKEFFPNCAEHYILFYRKIRCGILHQAESKGGFRILRRGLLFDAEAKTINADTFLEAVKCSLKKYVDSLGTSNRNEILWKNAVKKLRCICNNCQAA